MPCLSSLLSSLFTSTLPFLLAIYDWGGEDNLCTDLTKIIPEDPLQEDRHIPTNQILSQWKKKVPFSIRFHYIAITFLKKQTPLMFLLYIKGKKIKWENYN